MLDCRRTLPEPGTRCGKNRHFYPVHSADALVGHPYSIRQISQVVRPLLSLRGGFDRSVCVRHHLVVRNRRPRVGHGALDLRPEPPVVDARFAKTFAASFAFSLRLADEGKLAKAPRTE